MPGNLRDLYLLEKQLLLLDNFEQVISAASQVIDLLYACLKHKIMVISRATLHGEQEFVLPPLAVSVPSPMPDR